MKATLSIRKASSSPLILALLAVAVLSVLPLSEASAQIVFSDTFSSNTLSNYTVTSTGSAGITYNATSGISGGGGLAVANSGNPSTSIASSASFTLQTGIPNELTMSVFQRTTNNFGGTTQAFLGISNDISYNFGSNANATFSAIGLALTATQITVRSAVNGGASNNGAATAFTGSFIAGDWLRLNAIITKPVTGDIWTVSGSLENWGQTGASFASTVGTLVITNVTIANATFNNAATATYGQFGTRNQGFTAADNFSMTAVPEPSTYALLALGLGALFLLRRRKA